MKLLFLGDVVGRAGRDAISERLPGLIAEYGFDFVVVNGENASHGRGLTEQHFTGIRDAGADAVTLGDHAFDQRDTQIYIERETTLVRPINMAEGTPGPARRGLRAWRQGWTLPSQWRWDGGNAHGPTARPERLPRPCCTPP